MRRNNKIIQIKPIHIILFISLFFNIFLSFNHNNTCTNNTIEVIYSAFPDTTSNDEYVSFDIDFNSNKLASGIDKYLASYIKDEKYRKELVDITLRLINEKENHKHLVLYVLAIAKVESDFKMVHSGNNPKSTIFGLAQVSWYWHKDKLIKEGITKDKFFNDKYSSLKSGLIVFENYLKNNDFNYVKALEAYNPDAKGFSCKYISSINKEFTRLQMKIMYEILHS